MKKLLTILAIVCILAASLSISVFALTQNDGVYEIANAEDLVAFKNGMNDGTYPVQSKAVITADIDMTGKEWTPFNVVTMHIDGQGHTITGLTYTAENDSNNNGLFINRLVNNQGVASLKNLKFKDCTYNVTTSGGEAAVGLVCGSTDRAAVENVELINCSMTVTYTGTAKTRTGMVVGSACWGYANGEIPVSGVVNTGCTLTVTSTNGGATNVGGIVGHHWGDVMTLKNCVSNATITAPRAAQYVYELDNNVEIYVDTCSTTLTGLPVTGNAGKHVAVVASADALLSAIANINTGYQGRIKLLNDISLKDKTWTPITVDGYTGVFDGNGKTLSDINYTLTDVTSGTFGMIAYKAVGNGGVQNLTIKDSVATLKTPADGSTGTVNFGGVVGQSDRGHIENVHLQNVDITAGGKFGAVTRVGGIVAYACYNSNKGGISVFNCSLDVDSSVYAVGESGTPDVAGIVASFDGDTNWGSNLLIQDCVNYAPITSSHLAGGIAGWGTCSAQNNAITNCKNYGTIKCANQAGGILGGNGNGITILSNCVSGGFIIAPNAGAYYKAGSNVTVEESCRSSAIINPLTAESEQKLAGYYQLGQVDENTVNFRVVFLANLEYVIDVDALNVNITFTKAGNAVKYYNAPLGKEVYKTVTAAGDSYTAPENMILFGNVITGIPTTEADSFSVKVTDGSGKVVFSGGGIITGTSMESVVGFHPWSAPFEASGDFAASGNIGYIFYIETDGATPALFTTLNENLANGSNYAVVEVDGVPYRCGSYANSDYGWGGLCRFEFQSAGAVIYSGLSYTVRVRIYSSDDTLLYYSNEYAVTATQTSSNAPAREKLTVTLPEGLTKVTVDTATVKKEGITPWGDDQNEFKLFDGTDLKLGGNATGTVTVEFALTEAATLSYYTLTTGGDTASYTDRNPKSWTLYGKVGNEWVVLSNVESNTTHETGLEATNATPYSYAVTNQQECTEYKIVFSTNGAFQMNELELYK